VIKPRRSYLVHGIIAGAGIFLAGLTAARPVYAQALPTATGPGMYLSVGGTFSGFESDYGKQTISGPGIYADANPYWWGGLEGEVRRLKYSNFGESQTSLLVGPRWSIRSRGIQPYVKLLVGGGRFEFPYGYGRGDYFVVAPGGGVDLRVSEKVRVRLIDIEYQSWPGFTFGSLHPYGLSAGVSLQLLRGRTNWVR
jgi:hypothetical protein